MGHPEHNKPAAARRVEVAEFRNDVAGYLRQAQQGASFLITSDNELMTELRPPPLEMPAPERRSLIGAMHGQIWMADDFDTWPEDILDLMEGKEG